MSYLSPFNMVNVEHEGCEALSLSLGDDVNADETAWDAYYLGAIELITNGHDLTAFFIARHFVELSLKRLGFGPGHSLAELLDELPKTDPLRTSNTGPVAEIRAFVLDIGQVDPSGTEGRYAHTLGGKASLATYCCVDRYELARHLGSLYEYVQDRVSN